MTIDNASGYINHTKKFAFVHIAKTGGTSIAKTFNLKTTAHVPVSVYYQYNPNIKDYYVFSFVRNPWDRLVSAYFHYGKSKNKCGTCGFIHNSKTFKSFVLSLKDGCHFCKGIFIPKKCSLEHEKIIDIAKPHVPHTLMPQVWFLDDEISFIGRYENFQHDVDLVCEYLGYKNTNQKFRINNERNKDYRYYYENNDMIEIIDNLYKDDIERFGYEFE